MTMLLRDCGQVLSMASDFKLHYEKAMEVLNRMGDCPFVFVTSQFLLTTKLVTKAKLYALQLSEHFEMFTSRRDHIIKVGFLIFLVRLNPAKKWFQIVCVNISVA